MTIPRITDIIGYSAETSGANEQPRWGHFTAAWADEAQRRFEAWLAEPEHDGTLHADTIAALAERADLDRDEAEGYAYRQRAIDWINECPEEFWEEFGTPLLDDIERKFWG